MLRQLHHRLTPPVFDNEDLNRLAGFLHIILSIAVILTLVNILLRFFVTPDFLDGLWLNGIVLLVEVGLWLMLTRGYVRFIGYMLPAALWLIVTYVVVPGQNGVFDPSFMTYTTVIVIAGLIWGGRGALFMAISTGVLFLAFVTPESGLLWLNYTTALITIAVLLGIAHRSLYHALRRAKHSERELAAQNYKLRREIEDHLQAKTAKNSAEDKYRSIVENAAEGIFQTTAHGRFLSANPALAHMLGYDSPQELMTTITHIEHQLYVNPERRQEWINLLESNGEVRDFETQFYRKGGDIITVSGHVRSVQDEAGKFLYYEGMLQDITERKRAENALRESEERYRIVSELISDYAYSYEVEVDGSIHHDWTTESFTRLTGYTAEELGNGFSLYHPDDGSLAEVDAQKTIAGQITRGEYRIITKQGNTHWVEIYRRPVWDETLGRVVRFYGVARNITERKMAEEIVAQERNLLRTLIDHLPEDIFIIDRQGGYLINNAISMRLLGVSRQEDLIGKHSSDFFPPEITKTWDAREQRVIETGEAEIDREVEQPWRGVERRWMLQSLIPIHDTSGQVTGLVGVNRDITERKRAEDALRESEERYRIVSELISDYAYSFEATPDGMFYLKWATESLTRLTGYTLAELDKNFLVYHPDDQPRANADFQKTIAGQETQGVYRALTKTGETLWLEVYRRPVWDEVLGRVVRYHGVARDITARKQAQDALRESEERYRMISELISDYAFSARIESDGRLIQDWQTTSLERRFGYSPEEVSAQGLSLYHPDDAGQVQADLNTILQGSSCNGEYRLIAKNGEICWVHAYAQPVLDEQGRVIRFYGVIQDITQRKAEEDRQIELAVAAERQRVEVLKGFLSNATHDLRTPLTIMETSLYLLKKTVNMPEKQPRYIQQIDDQRNRMKEVIENMFSLSRLDMAQEDFSFARWDLNQLVEEVVDSQQSLASEKQHSLTLELNPQDLIVVADSAALMTALKHIVTNALNYTPNGGQICLKSYQREHQAVVEVTDNGIGISEGELPRIFERFYRIDKARQLETGTAGLGLTIARKIVQEHRGDIEVESTFGKGSIFRIHLPLCEHKPK